MKEIFKNGALLYVRLIVVAIMSLIVYASIAVIMTAAFTENIGYKAYVTDKEGKEIASYDYEYSEGDDKKLEEYTEKGYTVNKMNVRSSLEGKGAVLNNVLSQGIAFIIAFTFIYNKTFVIGNKDRNLVQFKHKPEDKLKGLKIGAVSMIPNFILFVIIAVVGLGFKSNMTVSVYSLPNFYIFGILKAIFAGVSSVGKLKIRQFALVFATLLIVPALAHLSYTLGYKDIFILEKLTYKSKKKE